MKNRKGVSERVDQDFANNVKRLYPLERSFGDKTKKLNSVLEDMLHGKTK